MEDNRRTNSRSQHWLVWLLAFLMLYIAICYFVSLVNIPTYIQRVSNGTVETLVVNSEILISQQAFQEAAGARGMSLSFYAFYSSLLILIQALGFCTAGALVLWKAERDPFRWFTAFILFFYPLGYLINFTEVGRVGYAYLNWGGVFWPAYVLFLYLFPNGRAVPRWSRWLIAPFLCLHLVLQASFIYALHFTLPDGVLNQAMKFFPIVFGGLGITLLCQVYRYFRASSIVERLQIRWFVAGLAFYLLISLILSSFTSRIDNQVAGYLSDLTDPVLSLVIPFSITIGILRYRLWDIDVIIRRTLVYGVLSASLAVVFFAGVTVLQSLFQAVSGQQSAISIVISTLAIAALFTPFRRRIQNDIDRRFFRNKYQAEQALRRFAVKARNELELEQLTAELLAVVEDSLHPKQASVWLRPDKKW